MNVEDPKKILVIQLYRIGDALLTTPAARALHETFPKARIDFLCEDPAFQLLRGHPDLSEAVFYNRKRPATMIWNIRRRRYDWVIDFLGNPRTAILTALSAAPLRAGSERVFHRWAYNRWLKHPAQSHYVGLEKMLMLAPLGVKTLEDQTPRLHLAQESMDFARRFYKKSGISPADAVVTISPVSRRHFNRWPLDRYAALCDWLHERFKAKAVLVWGPGEQPEAQKVANLAKSAPIVGLETRTLMDLAALLSRANLHVGNDNGVKHIAAAVGVPTFTIFGPHNPLSWTPPDAQRHRFIKKECLCRDDEARKHSCQELRCLNDVSLREVCGLIEPFLSEILTAKAEEAAK